MHGSNSTLGMDVEAARWMREAPEHDPTPLRCSEWYSTTPLRNTLERAVVVLWYHCGTLRLAEIFSGAGSQQLSPTGTYTPTTQLTLPGEAIDITDSIFDEWFIDNYFIEMMIYINNF